MILIFNVNQWKLAMISSRSDYSNLFWTDQNPDQLLKNAGDTKVGHYKCFSPTMTVSGK